MFQSDFTGNHRIPAPRRSANRLIAALLLVIVCFCAVCAKFLVDARNSAWQSARETTASLVAAIDLDILLNIESFDLALQAVAENLRHPEIDRLSPDLRQLLLFDRSTTARHLDAMLVLDATGHVRFDSRTVDPQPVSRADRDYFQFHEMNDTTGLHISPPVVARSTGQTVVSLSRRLSRPDGAFAGVVLGGLRLSYFEQLFKTVSLGPNDTMTLSSTDGTVLMHRPYQEELIGRDLKGAELYKHLARERAGSFETNAVTDGIQRLVVYSRVGDFPLVISVGRSTADIFADWRRYAFAIGLLVAALWLMTLYLIIELRRRGEGREQPRGPRHHRRADRARQSPQVQRDHHPRMAARHARTPAARIDDARCRPVQGIQRPARPPGRRQAAADDRPGDVGEHKAGNRCRRPLWRR